MLPITIISFSIIYSKRLKMRGSLQGPPAPPPACPGGSPGSVFWTNSSIVSDLWKFFDMDPVLDFWPVPQAPHLECSSLCKKALAITKSEFSLFSCLQLFLMSVLTLCSPEHHLSKPPEIPNNYPEWGDGTVTTTNVNELSSYNKILKLQYWAKKIQPWPTHKKWI